MKYNLFGSVTEKLMISGGRISSKTLFLNFFTINVEIV